MHNIIPFFVFVVLGCKQNKTFFWGLVTEYVYFSIDCDTKNRESNCQSNCEHNVEENKVMEYLFWQKQILQEKERSWEDKATSNWEKIYRNLENILISWKFPNFDIYQFFLQ